MVLFAAEGSPAENIGIWKKFASGPLEVEHVQGQHSQLLLEPYVKQIAGHIQQRMNEISKKSVAAR